MELLRVAFFQPSAGIEEHETNGTLAPAGRADRAAAFLQGNSRMRAALGVCVSLVLKISRSVGREGVICGGSVEFS